MSDDTEGRVIPFPAVGIRSPIGGDGAAGNGPDPDPPAGSTGPLLAPLFGEAESAGPPGGYPVLSGGRPVPPPSVLLPQLVDEPDGQVLQAPAEDGGERLSAAEAATLGVLVASAITVAAVRGTVALAGWFRARAEHHRAVQKKAGHGSGGGRVPSSVEYGRRSLAAHRSNGGGRSSGGGGGKGGGGRVPSLFRSSGGGGGSSSKRPSSGGGGSSRRSTTTSSGSGGLSSSGSGGKHRKRKPTNGGGGDAGSGGGRKAPRGPRPNKPSKASKAAKGGTESSTSSRTPKKPKRRKQAQADRHGGGGDGGGKLRTLRKLRKHDAPSSKTKTKGDGGGDKSKGGKGGKGGGKHKPKQTAKAAVTAAARRARRRALRSVRKTANKAVKATRRTVRRNTRRAARKTRSWARIGWERVAARAEARWTRRRSAGGPTGGSSSATPPPGGGSSRSTPPPGGPGPGSGPGPGGPHVGGRRPKPPPAWTDPYVVTLERLDDEPPARTAAGALAPPRHALPATPTAKEAHPVSQPPSRAYGTAPATTAAGSVQFAVDSDLTIHDLVESDEEVAAEVLARVDTAQQDARAAEALASRLDDLRVVLTERKVPGRLLGFVNRLIEQAGTVRSHAQALAKALPDASAAIEAAGRNAAARHKPLADATRDAGHAAPAERTYHRE